tara:strand:- start:507 stop:1052 length:546 start_codon:yes stop_codon:yes gene_type:complete
MNPKALVRDKESGASAKVHAKPKKKGKEGKEVYDEGGSSSKKKVDDINIGGIEPTATDTLQAYLHDKIPGVLEGEINKLNPNLLLDAEKSYEKTGDMSYEDFKSAANTLGLKSKEDVMKHLTNKDMSDLSRWKRGLVNRFVDMQSSLKEGGAIKKNFGGDVKGTGSWSGKSVPGMINGRHK